MNRRDDAQRDRANELDRAIDALIRGDHSGLDELPPDLAATVDRLFWLSGESGSDADQFTPWSRDAMQRDQTWMGDRIAPQSNIPPLLAPRSERTLRKTSTGDRGDVTTTSVSKPRIALSVFMRLAAVLVVVILAGGALYALAPILDDAGRDHGGAPNSEELEITQLHPDMCNISPDPSVARAGALDVLRDVDVNRDEALRRSVLIRPVEQDSVPIDRLTDRFVMWQSCRRFGFTYEAMALQTPYFLRADFYGETTLDFRGPVQTAYSDATLNEMLDRREELDATSRQYWENAGHYPDPTLTLILGGETFASEDRSFIAVRAMTFDVQSETWQETTTVVVFHMIDGEPFLFDIQSTPIGTPPYL